MEETCLADSATTHTILRETKYFESIKKSPGSIMTIAGCGSHIVGSGRATIILPMGTTLIINDALLYPESTRTLLSFRDIPLMVSMLRPIMKTARSAYSSQSGMPVVNMLSKGFLRLTQAYTTLR